MKEYEKFVNHVSKLQGLPRQYGIHAAGLIISSYVGSIFSIKLGSLLLFA
ncbi:hypothetical protein [Mycoplasmopsis bovis]